LAVPAAELVLGIFILLLPRRALTEKPSPETEKGRDGADESEYIIHKIFLTQHF
jgi:hypothetical protein